MYRAPTSVRTCYSGSGESELVNATLPEGRTRLSNREWVVYELVDPLDQRVLVRDARPAEYTRLLAAYPVIEVGDKGWEAVDAVHRAGRVPYFREITRVWGEANARREVVTRNGVEALLPMLIARGQLVHA